MGRLTAVFRDGTLLREDRHGCPARRIRSTELGAFALHGGAHGERPATEGAQALPVHGQGQQFRLILFSEPGLPGRHRMGEPAPPVIEMADRFSRFPAVQLRRRNTESVGGLYSATETRFVLEAAREKGMLTSDLFRFHATSVSLSHWCSVMLP
jgi:hypothetical protein